jgi:hypothetical protein
MAAGTTALILLCGCASGYVSAGVSDPYAVAPIYSEPYYYDPFYYGPDVYVFDGYGHPYRHYAHEFSHRGFESRGHFRNDVHGGPRNYGHVGRAPGAMHGGGHGTVHGGGRRR